MDTKNSSTHYAKHVVVNSALFSEWYLQVLKDAELADYAPVKGCMVIRPYAYSIWELIQSELDSKIKAQGVRNAYFPLFIPEHFITKEKKHVEGFSPELAVVTHAGGEELEEPLVVRPTSETMVYYMFEKWIKSHKDLPLKINQWANVVRWEKRTKPFLRTSEFLWQEGHTAHGSEEEAFAFAQTILDLYVSFLRDFLAIPVISGFKPESEKFAGAKYTFTMEPIMQDGKALQVGTSHLLESSFPKAFDIFYQDSDKQLKTPWCTSWGVTTRLIGAVIMVHGDLETGLVLPPKIAPYQVSVIPIRKTSDDRTLFDSFLEKILKQLETSGLRYVLFDDETSPGKRFNESEKKGIPLRIEFGMRDVLSLQVVLVPRLAIPNQDKKIFVPIDSFLQESKETLKHFQNFLLARATDFLQKNTFLVSSFEELKNHLDHNPGFYEVFWCQGSPCENLVKSVQCSFRVKLEKTLDVSDNCFVCQEKASCKIIVAKSY